jgi:hypothetical protein
MWQIGRAASHRKGGGKIMSWLSEAFHNSDAGTISAIAAWAAAGVALTGATFQFFIGRKQAQAALTSAQAALMTAKNSGRHKIAEFRQAWIYKVTDALSTYHSILMASDRLESVEDRRKAAALRTELEIYLNPNEEDTVKLLLLMAAIATSATVAEREARDDEMIQTARTLLKKEWTRLKGELD